MVASLSQRSVVTLFWQEAHVTKVGAANLRRQYCFQLKMPYEGSIHGKQQGGFFLLNGRQHNINGSHHLFLGLERVFHLERLHIKKKPTCSQLYTIQ
ncbi:hypothetical protein VIGAN_03141500 [Vigna angularis var. angularis]|uniref:Uncharacterized protein n=1 Tax=Vigna angularis var. angularis TaxID=157739 RepID=A0A0S3RM04_PHAAN|nr:hypothetical protein VIGAN_03141500 [Vigna angularis var. angularis]